MKTLFYHLSSILFLIIAPFLPSSFLYAQYDSEGNYFKDSTKISKTFAVTKVVHKANFETPNKDNDTIYIHHLVAEGESIASILNMYQLCAPCFAEWNNYSYSSLKNLKRQKLYEGEYLKVALRKDYYKGFPSKPFTYYFYENITKTTPLYKIAKKYAISTYELKKWNGFNEYVYNVEANTKIIVGKTTYKYVCPCKDVE